MKKSFPRSGPGTIVNQMFPGKTTRQLNEKERLALLRRYHDIKKEVHAATMKRCRERLMNLFLSRYGTTCLCCGESSKCFLTIEHLNGGGSKHRKSLPGGIERIIRDIRDRGWPDGYATLCMNCNFGKWRNGGTCPHVVSKAMEFLAEVGRIQKEMDESTPAIGH